MGDLRGQKKCYKDEIFPENMQITAQRKRYLSLRVKYNNMLLFGTVWLACLLAVGAGNGDGGQTNEVDPTDDIDIVKQDADEVNTEQDQPIDENKEDMEENGEVETDPKYYLGGPAWQGALCPSKEPNCKDRNTIAYTFDNNVQEKAKKAIKAAIKHIEKHVKCINFHEVTLNDISLHKLTIDKVQKPYGDYMRFKEGRVCKTTYGRRAKDIEEKVLGHEILISTETNGCAFMGGVLHQILHALGFAHEHARPDRDDYVEVHLDNIKPEYKRQFDTVPKNAYVQWEKEDKYDYASIMHFPEKRYGKVVNNKRLSTITVKNKFSSIWNFLTRNKLGQRKRLSKLDIRKLRLIWGC